MFVFCFFSSFSLQLPHATVSCVECISVALLFEQVLLSFFGCDATSLLPRSPSLSDFVRIYRQQCSQSPAKQTRYIVSGLYTPDENHCSLGTLKYNLWCPNILWMCHLNASLIVRLVEIMCK